MISQSGRCEGSVQQIRGGISFKDGRKNCRSAGLATVPVLSVPWKGFQEKELKTTRSNWSASCWKFQDALVQQLSWLLAQAPYVTLVWTLHSKGSLPHVLRIRLIVIVELLLSVLWSWWWPYLKQTCDIPVIQCNPKTVMPKYILQLSYIVFCSRILNCTYLWVSSHKAWVLIG